jgi:hypothetical protein
MTFKTNKRDLELIRAITERAMALAEQAGAPREKISIMMDISACHANGNRLRLDDLLTADDFNFAHDVFGIERHMDRETGKLTDCFSPRFSARTDAA